ncbi:MAG: hypothetical protein R2728_05335 [Chitinophagales bacterium]
MICITTKVVVAAAATWEAAFNQVALLYAAENIKYGTFIHVWDTDDYFDDNFTNLAYRSKFE